MLTDRQMLILQAIIDYYTQYEEPVGSRTLSMYDSIKASSATIRNEMARLEALNLIEKTHSSSGRIPVESGYRYYIHHIMPRFGGIIDYGLSTREQEMIHNIFNQPYIEYEEIIAKSVETLALLSQNVVIALGPAALNQKLAGFQLAKLSDTKGMAILLTDVGTVENQVFTLPKKMTWNQLNQLTERMNQHFVGLPLPKVIEKLQVEMSDLNMRSELFADHSLIQNLVNKIDGERVTVSGRQLLYQHLTENNGIQTIHSLNQVLDDQKLLIDLIHQPKPGIRIQLGKELSHPSLEKMSLMTANMGNAYHYQLTYALLGPENMSYVKMAQLIHGFRKEWQGYLTQKQHEI